MSRECKTLVDNGGYMVDMMCCFLNPTFAIMNPQWRAKCSHVEVFVPVCTEGSIFTEKSSLRSHLATSHGKRGSGRGSTMIRVDFWRLDRTFPYWHSTLFSLHRFDPFCNVCHDLQCTIGCFTHVSIVNAKCFMGFPWIYIQGVCVLAVEQSRARKKVKLQKRNQGLNRSRAK